MNRSRFFSHIGLMSALAITASTVIDPSLIIMGPKHLWEFEDKASEGLHQMRKNGIVCVGLLTIIVAGLVTYYPATRTTLYADDWSQLELAGRTPLSEYLPLQFDPLVQTITYRPVKSMVMFLEYRVLGPNYSGYHFVQILFHLIGSVLIFGLVSRSSRDWRLGFISALLFVGFPVYANAVVWQSVHDPLVALIYLITLGFWMRYLESSRRLLFWLAVLGVTLCLLTKEIGMTLPIVLFLFDRLVVGKSISIVALIRRYAPMAVMLFIYLIIQLYIQRSGWFTVGAGNRLGPHMLTNLTLYLGALAFPWSVNTWANHLALFGASVGLILVLRTMKSRAVAFLIISALLNVLPVIGFEPWYFQPRFVYLSGIAIAILLAGGLLWLTARSQTRVVVLAAITLISIVSILNGFGVADSTAQYGEIARRRRVPFRDITAHHPLLQHDSLLYLITSPVSQLVTDLSGMFFLEYGPSIHVSSPDTRAPANLSAYNEAYVYYFDETNRPIQVVVAKGISPRANHNFPVDFESEVRLNGFEIANPTLRRGETLAILLYWSAREPIGKDYTVFAHLVDEKSNFIAGYDSQPWQGYAPTTAWRVGEIVVDNLIIEVPREVPPGENYRLEIGLYYLPTLERANIVDTVGQVIADQIVIVPFTVK